MCLPIRSHWVKPMALNWVFTAFLVDAQHLRDSEENKPASLLVVALGKEFLAGFSHVQVVDRWVATLRRARYSAWIDSSQ